MSSQTEPLSVRVKTLTTMMLDGSVTAGEDLALLARCEAISFQRIFPAVRTLLDVRRIDPVESIAPTSLFTAMHCFELVSIGIGGLQARMQFQTVAQEVATLFPLIHIWTTHIVGATFDHDNHIAERETFIPVLSELLGVFVKKDRLIPRKFCECDSEGNVSFLCALTRVWLHSVSSGLHDLSTSIADILGSSSCLNSRTHPSHVEFLRHPREVVSRALTVTLGNIVLAPVLDLRILILFLGGVLSSATSIAKSSVVFGADGLFAYLIRVAYRLISPKTQFVESDSIIRSHILGEVIQVIFQLLRGGYLPIMTAMKYRLPELLVIGEARYKGMGGKTYTYDYYYDAPENRFAMVMERQMPHLFYPSVLKVPYADMQRPGSLVMQDFKTTSDMSPQWTKFQEILATWGQKHRDFRSAVRSQCGHALCTPEARNTGSMSVQPMRCCSDCFHTAYCSVACQRADWKARHRRYCKQIVHHRDIGRLYTSKIPRIDEEFWLWLAVGDLHGRASKLARGIIETANDEVVLVMDYQYAALGETYKATYLPTWEDGQILAEWIEGCRKHWNDWVDETPWPIFCAMVKQMHMEDEHPVLLVAPLVDDRTLKFLTSVERLQARRYAA